MVLRENNNAVILPLRRQRQFCQFLEPAISRNSFGA